MICNGKRLTQLKIYSISIIEFTESTQLQLSLILKYANSNMIFKYTNMASC